jgi:hypothetical protein
VCNWMDKARAQYQNIGHIFVEDSFPQFVNRLPPSTLKQGHCWLCRRTLSPREMFPNGHPPRYMCRECYEKVAYSWPKNRCITCGRTLPPHQIQLRTQNPRELTHALHKGKCEDYHSVMAGIVLGVPFQLRYPAAPISGFGKALPHQPLEALPQPQLMEQIECKQLIPARDIKYLELP